ncbi:MarR family winged helix-turn-helix transcriptional regulator [Nocardioides sp. LS1]|uniref:MarR family winged helix-turn-helix transcriptional regulator n=1 Tax=Nocardioides sp. LS1 TaxID=1027620 RepID=UPI000F61FE9A|nr:MarR family transcriptional regulator [Nocardioides sp. LS1]GCD91156.1 transcriptional regulator [Nocardioides sp. LS1]
MANETQNNSGEFDFELVDQVGYLIRVSQQVHFALWNSSDDVGGLTSPQFAVLHNLAHNEPLDQTELGGLASLDRSTLANIVTRLAERGLVRRTRDTVDGRRNLVSLTPEGKAVHAGAVLGAYKINETLLTSMPESDRKSLLRILGTLISKHREASTSNNVRNALGVSSGRNGG